jgi:hypothetical protein
MSSLLFKKLLHRHHYINYIKYITYVTYDTFVTYVLEKTFIFELY